MVDIKELKKLVKYLRQEGISEFKSGDVELKLDLNKEPKQAKSKKIDVSEQVNITTDEPSREELLFWSAGGATETPKDS